MADSIVPESTRTFLSDNGWQTGASGTRPLSGGSYAGGTLLASGVRPSNSTGGGCTADAIVQQSHALHSVWLG